MRALLFPVVFLELVLRSFSQTPELVDSFVLGPKNPAVALTLADDGYLYGTSLKGGAYGFGTVYRISPDGFIQTFASFSGTSGALPGGTATSKLLKAPDGNLYGVTETGGPNDAGTVFKVTPGQGVAPLGAFTGTAGVLPGVQPQHALALGADGQLYGTTRRGGSADAGTIFKVTLSNGAVSFVAALTGGSGALPGYYPSTTLALAGDGHLYGAADTGGDSYGMIFKVSPAGVATTVASFTGNTGPLPGIGRFCSEQLTADGKGNLYGTTEQGGPAGLGAIFKIRPGLGVTSIAVFTGTSGTLPGANPFNDSYLTFAADGALYGTAQKGGVSNSGVIFRVGPNDEATTVASFTNMTGILPGALPRSPLTEASDGNLYGTVRDGPGAGSIYRYAPGGTATVIGSLTGNGGAIPGYNLQTPLTRGLNGIIYGIADLGGSANAGAAFRIDPNLGLSSLGVFFDSTGSAPRFALTAAADGHLFGTAPEGGITGSGVIFKVKPGSGGIQTIAGFTGDTGDLVGAKPWNRLVATPNGRLYGTTVDGGLQRSGSLFEVTLSGMPEVLANFGSTEFKGTNPLPELARAGDGRLFGSASPDFSGRGAFYSISASGQVNASSATLSRAPAAALQQAGDGKFYGITADGGTGFGTVFVFDAATNVATTIGTFTGQSGALLGRIPRSKLTLAADGSLYGTTTSGGTSNAGTVFRVTTAGIVTNIASFTGSAGALAGNNPSVALVAAENGDLYGLTAAGGTQNLGTVFRVVPGLSPTVQHVAAFTGTGGVLPGSAPLADLVRGPDQNLYGTTSAGGISDNGTIFRVVPGGGVTTVQHFTGRSGVLPGGKPLAPLALASDSNLYGLTSAAGTGGGGTLFRLVFGPTVETGASSLVSFTKASLNSVVNANSNNSDVWFEYGTTEALGMVTSSKGIAASETAAAVSIDVQQLQPDTTYFYRVVGRNPIGTQRGSILSFRTKPAFAPVAHTFGVEGVRARRAQLLGRSTGNGRETTAYFEVGTTQQYGTSTNVRLIGPEDVGSEYSVVVEGLLPHTEYHFRAVATSPAGKGVGEDLSFTTANTNPVAQPKTLHAPAVGAATVVYSAAVDTSDEDGDARQLEVVSYSGTGSATSNGSEVSYVNGGLVGSDTITVRVSDGFGGSAQTTVTLRNEAPVARADSFRVGSAETVLSVLANDGDTDGDALEITAASASSGGSVSIDGQTLKYLPSAGFSGVEVFSYSISDHRGGTASAQVTVMADYSVVRTAAEKKGLVPGHQETIWKRFGTPSLFAGGTRAGWLAKVKAGRQSYQGIFSGDIGSPLLRVRSGDAAPTSSAEAESEGKFTKFAEPVFAGDRFAFLGTVSGKKITAGNDTGIWVGEGSTLRAVAREGSSAPGTNGARYRSFTSLAMPGGEAAFFVAKLESVGTAKVTDANDVGLWIWSPSGTRLALREGQTVDLGSGTLRVRKFEVLPLVGSSAGHGRYDAAEQSVDARITFADGSVAIATVGIDGAIRLISRTGETDSARRIPEVLGYPSSPGDGAKPVAIVSFRPGAGGVTKQSDQTVYDFEADQVLTQEGVAAPGANGGKFLSFVDVVAGRGPDGNRVTALLGTLSGVTKAGDTGVWVSREGASEPLELVAREGTEPPGAPGTVFKSFESLSVQEGRGVLFKAKLASGTSAVKRSNDEGLWATDSVGELRLLLRKGEVIGGKTLQAFSILSTVARTEGQRRAWSSEDPAATLIYVAYFTDGSNAILTNSVP